MVVLVVDDQINVVSGIVFGVDWKKYGVKKVLKAYNAFEAEEIINKEAVDIMLCDIEMPVKSGLELFRWVKEKNKNIECIFLTAHADFMYAKEAISLESFDYILQPARYSDIENAILGASRKIKRLRESQMYTSYGKMIYHQKYRIIDVLLQDFMTGKIEEEILMKDFETLDIDIYPHTNLYLVLVNIIGCESAEKDDDSVIVYSLHNILTELFERLEQSILMTQMDAKNFLFFIYPKKDYIIEEQVVKRQLITLVNLCNDSMWYKVAAYSGGAVLPKETPDNVNELTQLKNENVSLISSVFTLGEELKTKDSLINLPNMEVWGSMLINSSPDMVYEEINTYLKKLSDSGRLTANLLKKFYQEFMHMIHLVFEQTEYTYDQLFDNQKQVSKEEPYLSIDSMMSFVGSVTNYFKEMPITQDKMENQVEQIIQYIRNNLDKDIRRSDIAAVVFLNPSYISRLFKKATGVPLKRFIMEEKIKMAQALVKTTELPISMIAIKVGFTNFSYFSQVYKKLLGFSPGDDRKSSLER